jgi:anti-anti-sigma factor
MDIVVSLAGRTNVLSLSGALDTASAPALSVRAMALCDSGMHAILIDLGQVPYLTSAGFRSFIAINKRAEQAGVAMALCGMNDLVRDLYEASGLRDSFRVYPDRAAALADIDQSSKL